MYDFRKLISAKSRSRHDAVRQRMIDFQNMTPDEMAGALLECSRCLIDSGLFQHDPQWSYDEWAIYRCIPALAKRLDPSVELRSSEIPKDEERLDPLTWIEEGDDQKLLSSIVSIIKNVSLMRAMADYAPNDVKDAAEIIILHRSDACALSVAMDTVIPGSFPKRVKPDLRAALDGYQVIASCNSKPEAEHDVVMCYEDELDVAKEKFRVLGDYVQGEELSDEDKVLLGSMDRIRYRRSVSELSLQRWSGEKLMELDLREPDTDLSPTL